MKSLRTDGFFMLLWLLTTMAATTPPPAEPLPLPVVRYDFSEAEDLDYDDQPDDWIRRKGVGFPHFVRSVIDRNVGSNDLRSLRIDLQGAAAAIYSPLTVIDPLHTLVFSGRIRTSQLQHGAAVISVSFLNHKRQRLERHLTMPIHGGLTDWQLVKLGPLAPPAETRFVVLGCHVLEGSQKDVQAQVWFDDLRLGKLPRLSLENNFFAHYRKENEPLEIVATASGLDHGFKYEIRMELIDVDGTVITRKQDELTANTAEQSSLGASRSHPVEWKLPQQDPSYYRLVARLFRDGALCNRQETSFVVMELSPRNPKAGGFGWSITNPATDLSLNELAEIAGQTGINYLKFPLWNAVSQTQPDRAGRLATFMDRLIDRHIEPVAVLSDPPPELREKFARNWLGVSEIFKLPPATWAPSLQRVLARYSSMIRHWQLGADDDTSFQGLENLPALMRDTRQEIRRICRGADLGFAWDIRTPLPQKLDSLESFLSLTGPANLEDPQWNAAWKNQDDLNFHRWMTISPRNLSGKTIHERASSLGLQMVQARALGAKVVFLTDVIGAETGLLNQDGSPTALFLPWRTVATTLQEAVYLGELKLPRGSRNAIFIRDSEAIVVLWNPEATTEQFYFGETPEEVDLWGRKQSLSQDSTTGEQVVEVGPVPKIIRSCAASVIRWRMAMRFDRGEVPSEYGSHRDAVTGKNTFSQGISGSINLKLPSEWDVEPASFTLQAAAGESFKLPFHFNLPANVALGNVAAILDVQLTADRPYKFRVLLPYHVGSADVAVSVTDRALPDGRLEIEQVVINRTSPSQILNFRCSLFVPGERRQRLLITKLGEGEDRKFFYVPNAHALKGEELWLRLEEEGGRRMLNFRWKVGSDWEPETGTPKPKVSRKPGPGATRPEETRPPQRTVLREGTPSS